MDKYYKNKGTSHWVAFWLFQAILTEIQSLRPHLKDDSLPCQREKGVRQKKKKIRMLMKEENHP